MWEKMEKDNQRSRQTTKDHCVPGRLKGGEWSYTEERAPCRATYRAIVVGFPVDGAIAMENPWEMEVWMGKSSINGPFVIPNLVMTNIAMI